MFEKPQWNIKTGAEGYIKYLEYKKKKTPSSFLLQIRKFDTWLKNLNKTQKQGLAIICICIGVLGLMLIIIQSIFFPQTPTHVITLQEQIINTPWESLLKLLVPVVAVAWILHGVQLRILA
jgi:hypothetical protein